MKTNDKALRPIQTSVAILVEGSDYFYSLLPKLDGPAEFADVQLWDFSSKGTTPEQFVAMFQTLNGYADKVNAIGIIRDAETDAQARCMEVQQVFEKHGLGVPAKSREVLAGNPTTGFLIMPHGETSGCLEHALLSAVNAKARLNCVKDYLTCADQKAKNDNWRAKMQVHSLIAASEAPAATLGQSVVKTDLWDFSQPSLGIMLDFIRDLIKQQRRNPKV
jgi:hypothetical protein